MVGPGEAHREVWRRSDFFGRRENLFSGGLCGEGAAGLGVSGPMQCWIPRAGGDRASSDFPERVVVNCGSNVVSDSMGLDQVEVGKNCGKGGLARNTSWSFDCYSG